MRDTERHLRHPPLLLPQRRPTYFVSATPFNLLGMDEWVRNFTFVNYIDCFDGAHPHVFVPSAKPHRRLREHRGDHQLPARHKGDRGRHRAARRSAATPSFLFFDEQTEELCEELGLEVCFPPAKLRQQDRQQDHDTTRIGNEAGVKSVPERAGQGDELRAAADAWRKRSQARRQPGGPDRLRRLRPHDLLHLRSEADYRKYAEEIEAEGGQGHEARPLPRLGARGLRHAPRHDRRPADDRAGRLQGADALQGRLVRQRGLRRAPSRAGARPGARSSTFKIGEALRKNGATAATSRSTS